MATSSLSDTVLQRLVQGCISPDTMQLAIVMGAPIAIATAAFELGLLVGTRRSDAALVMLDELPVDIQEAAMKAFHDTMDQYAKLIG